MNAWNAYPGDCTSSLCLPGVFARVLRHAAPQGIWVIRRAAARKRTDGSGARLPEGAPTKLELQTYVTSKLKELRCLELGWDGAQAGPVTQKVTHEVYRTLDQVTEARSVYPFVTPTAEGGILAEWRAGKERIEIEFTPNDDPYVYVVDSDGVTQVDGYLRERGTLLGVRRALKEISQRVWATNPTWKRLFT